MQHWKIPGMAAKYIIGDGHKPFLCPVDTPLWDFYNSFVKAGLLSVATSCGKCYYDPQVGWTVFSNTEDITMICIPCKHKEDAEILNRHLFV